WGSLAASGFGLLATFEATPGDAGRPRADWPGDSRIGPNPKRPNLVMFVHPRCPCTRAGLVALIRVLDRSDDAVALPVVLVRPEGAPGGSERSESWRQAAGMQGVRVHTDPDGVEARRFGAATSGHVLVFDSLGRCLFSGGITRGRGVEGQNDWGEAVVALA